MRREFTHNNTSYQLHNFSMSSRVKQVFCCLQCNFSAVKREIILTHKLDACNCCNVIQSMICFPSSLFTHTRPCWPAMKLACTLLVAGLLSLVSLLLEIPSNEYRKSSLFRSQRWNARSMQRDKKNFFFSSRCCFSPQLKPVQACVYFRSTPTSASPVSSSLACVYAAELRFSSFLHCFTHSTTSIHLTRRQH